MNLPVLRAFVTVALFVSSAHATKLDRPTIETTTEGTALHIVIHGVTDYCSTDADTTIERTKDTIRIVRDRPSRVSRCIDTRDVTFVVEDVRPGRYLVSYERMPLVAPARLIRVAAVTAIVRE